ncbi:hypothetical protein SynA1562_02443 [Synechococcus sp. A15-62]|nr:hypothetical protein SynA1562_02443 [Synechococcus sp. A15-62]
MFDHGLNVQVFSAFFFFPRNFSLCSLITADRFLLVDCLV